MYEYAPRSKKNRELRLFLVTLTPALLFWLLPCLPQTPAPMLCRLLGACAAMASAWIAARYLLRSYVYRIAPRGNDDGSLDLTVTESFGKRRRVVCRISLADIEAVTRESGSKRRGFARPETCFQYTDVIFSDLFCVLTVYEENAICRIKIMADEKLYSILKGYR